MQSDGEKGQSLIFVMLAMPLMFALVALVVDGAYGFVQRRSVQNAADAAALAIADKDLDLYGAQCSLNTDCQTTVAYYSNHNGGPSLTAADACSASKTTNCYTLEFPASAGTRVRVRVTLHKHVSTFFGGVMSKIFGGTPLNYNVSASASASSQATGVPLFAFAMQADTSCTAIQINGPNNNAVGGDDFPGLWSNGGIKVNSPLNTTTQLLLNKVISPSPCALPPVGSLSDPSARGVAPVKVSYVSQRPPTTDPTSSSWPSPIPAIPNSCTQLNDKNGVTVSDGPGGVVTFDDGKTVTTRGPGCYWASKFSINGSGTAANPWNVLGFTFVADGDITLTSAANWGLFGCTPAAPCSVQRTPFYSINGNVGLNSNTAVFAGCNNAIDPACQGAAAAAACDRSDLRCGSEIYAPGVLKSGNPTNGNIAFTGGSTASFSGIMEGQTLTILAKQTKFFGTGSLVGSREPASLDE